MKRLSNFDLACLPEGTRVIFAEAFDIFPDALIPQGATGVIQENGFNDIWSGMLIRLDDEKLREQLKEWDGCVHLSGGDPSAPAGGSDPSWQQLSPLALAS